MTKRMDHEAVAKRAKAIRKGVEFVQPEDRVLSPKGYLPATDEAGEPDYDPQDIVREALILAAEQEALERRHNIRGGTAMREMPQGDLPVRTPDGKETVVQKLPHGKRRNVIFVVKPLGRRKKP